MAEIHDIDNRRKRSPLPGRYSLISQDEFPRRYNFAPVSYKPEEVNAYELLLFHRILERDYGAPLFFEQSNISMPGLTDWIYPLSTESGTKLFVQSKNELTRLSVGVLIETDQSEPSEEAVQEAKGLIEDLLQEAERVASQLLNPRREFKEGNGPQLYLVHNVYLLNYDSAELMLDSVEDHEQDVWGEIPEYEPGETFSPKETQRIEKFLRAAGMYWASAIFFYFTALEGFVNLVYHAFARHEYRGKDLRLDQRLDLELKLILMPSLCDGFASDPSDRQSQLFKRFKELKKLRNQIFHARIEDSLQRITFVQSGCLYSCPLDESDKRLLPSLNSKLRREHVVSVKGIVDDMIQDILARLEEDKRRLVEKNILDMHLVGFSRSEEGVISLGQLT